jgi:isoleucyl-tRNA synthetase
MPLDKVDTQVDFPALERRILEFWKNTRAFERLVEKNRGKKPWSFLDGPITANNPMGVHHAWGRTYKDLYQRYFAMTGHELRYQNGFDCQGLWVEVEVEKAMKLQSKRDIENLVPGDSFASIDKFVTECKARVDKFAKVQTEQSIRLGYWMEWDREEDWAKKPDDRRSYFTMSEENNYTIWAFLKKCHERGLVYRGYDAMPWCPRCAVGLSQMEMHEGYAMVAHRSVFVKFPLRLASGDDAKRGSVENLLIWTTTPWTLSSNVAAAVNPELTYLKIKHKDEIYYLAKGAFTAQRLEEQFKRKEWVEGVPKLKTLEQIFKEKGGYEIVAELPGKELVGWTYDGPFDHLDAQKHVGGFPVEIAEIVVKQKWGPNQCARDLHRVVAWDQVGEAEGTGIVHIAPGCGKEDFHLGKEQGLVPVAPLNENGVFVQGFHVLTGLSAVDPATTDVILDYLTTGNLLFASERYPHSYPHCWRCKTELLFRLVDEWFINMKWREEIMGVVEKVTFLPESINGKARELDWLKNMGDWMISKKRYWGLALPIWACEKCGHFDVVGGRGELKKRAVSGWEEFEGLPPHRPWIDLVKISCGKCGETASRVSDVGNPWLDAGIVPYSTMKYNTDRKYWEKWFPADFITECFPGQFRNWFYAILAMSTMMENRPPFKVLLGHGLVRDERGEEMHKSKGNSIAFGEAADTGWEVKTAKGVEKRAAMGADLMRWLYCRNQPAANINFGSGPAEELRAKFVLKLWNSYAFFCNYAALDGFDPAKPQVPVKDRPDIDRWILSELQLLIQTARKSFEEFNVMAFCLEAEKFVDAKLSNWYIRRNRPRFWKSEKGPDKQAAYLTLYTVLETFARLIAPVMPFLSEVMYQNLAVGGADLDAVVDIPGSASVHHTPYPEADEALIDSALSAEMDALLGLVTLGSAARNQVKIKVRQPLAELTVQPGSDVDRRAALRFADQICDELNIKKVAIHDPSKGPLLRLQLKPNPKNLGPKKVNLKLDVLKHDTEESAMRLWSSLPLEIENADGAMVSVTREDFFVSFKGQEGWVGVVDKDTQVAIDTRLTPELILEGLAREIVRNVQDSRKKAGLEVEDRIALYLATEDAELAGAIARHKAYVMNETLAAQWGTAPLDGADAFRADVKVDGRPLRIELQKYGAV